MKAQVWSIDFIVSVMAFTAVVALMLFVWKSASTQAGESIRIGELQKVALNAADMLVRSPGIPPNWTSEGVVFMGLAEREGVISPDKVSEMLGTGYNESRKALHIGSGEFYISLRDYNGTLLNVTAAGNQTAAEHGSYPNGSGFVVPVERYVLFNGELARLRLIVWEQ